MKAAGHQLEPYVAVHQQMKKKPPRAERAGAAIPACRNDTESLKDGHGKTMQPGQTAESCCEEEEAATSGGETAAVDAAAWRNGGVDRGGGGEGDR